MKTSTDECVPEELTGQLKRFCDHLSASDRVLIDVEAPEWATNNNCVFNARRQVEECLGRAVNGWKIWHWPRVWFHAVHHCVWEKPDGTLVDVTPQENGATKVFFARCDSATFDLNVMCFRNDIYMGLWGHKKLDRLIALVKQRDFMIQRGVNLAKDPVSGDFVDAEFNALMIEARALFQWVAKKRK